MKFTTRLLAFIFISTMIVSCAKDGEDGAIGPQGSQGEQGVAGIAGADGEQGDQGEQGETGTANVIYSDWLDTPIVDNDNNIMSPTANGSLDVPGLSQEIVDQGTVLVYGKVSANDNIYALPYIGNQGVSYYYFFNVEEINIRLTTVDGSNIGEPLFATYRYILIPGGVEASNGSGGLSGGKSSSIDYTKMTYAEVVAHFNITE